MQQGRCAEERFGSRDASGEGLVGEWAHGTIASTFVIII
jgi:hypothetical protein